MWNAIGVVFVVLFLVVCVSATTDLSQTVHAQELVAFENPELLAEALDRNAIKAVTALEKILTSEQVVAFEATMLPPPSNETKRARYLAARKSLRAAGITKTDPSLIAVSNLIKELPAIEIGAESIVELSR